MPLPILRSRKEHHSLLEHPRIWSIARRMVASVSFTIVVLMFYGCGGAILVGEPSESPTTIQETPISPPPEVSVSKPGDSSTDTNAESGELESTDNAVNPPPEEKTESQAILAEPPKDEGLSLEDSQKVQDLVWEAHFQLEGGNPKKAISLYEQALEIAPNSSFVLMRLGQVLLDTGQVQKAHEIAQRAAAAEPEDAEIQGLLSETYASTGDFESALRAAQEEIRINPNSVQGYLHIAGFAAQLQRADLVIEALQKLTYLDSRNAGKYRYQQATILASQGRVDEAVELYRELLQQFPDNGDVWVSMAELLEATGRVDDALETYRQALEANLDARQAMRIRYLLAERLRDRQAYAEAYAEYQKIRDQKPDEVRAWGDQIEILIEMKKYDEAIDEINSYLALVPFDVRIALLNPVCRLELGQADEAARGISGILATVMADSRSTPLDYYRIGLRLLDPKMQDAIVASGVDATIGTQLLEAQETATDSLLIPASLLMLERKLGREAAASAQLNLLADRLCILGAQAENGELRALNAREAALVFGVLRESPGNLAEILTYKPKQPKYEETWSSFFERLALLLEDGKTSETVSQSPHAATIRNELHAFLKEHPDSLAVRLALIYISPDDELETNAFALLDWLDSQITRNEAGRVERTVSSLFSGKLFEIFTEGAIGERTLRSVIIAETAYPENSLYGYAHGLSLSAQNRDEEAEKQLRQTLEKMTDDDPWYLPASKRLAWIMDRMERYEDALDLLVRLKEIVGDDPDIYRHMALIYDKTDDVEKMEAAAKRVIDLIPNDAESYNMLGYIYAVRNINLDEAVRLIKQADELDPDNGNIVDSLGWVYYRLGYYDRSVETLERAAELMGKEHPVVLDHLGDAYAKTGRINEAIPKWKRALEIGPKYPYEFTPEFQAEVREKVLNAGGTLP